jgi:asparagine synthase (glutamine-hydrolysing)
MCGIFAIWSPAGGATLTDLERPLTALAHRGPDGSGAWAAPDGRAALAHTRLAVVGLRRGAQPIGSADEMLQLVVTGELYDYEQIRAELERSGCRFRTDSDSEIALHLYRTHGVDALHELRGEFALVLWDGRARRLLAARDRFGIKPLLHARHGDRLLIASEVKALAAAGLRLRWDEDALLDHLHVALAPDRTVFAGVHQVPPGSYLLADDQGMVVRRWWDLDYPRVDELAPLEELDDHVVAIAAALDDAVAVRQRADVPVASHLSGGIDSSSVTALARKRGRIAAFTVRFTDERFDEGAAARRTARSLGADYHEVVFPGGDFRARLIETVRWGEMVQENAHGSARLLQSAHIRAHGYKAILAGEGGDELFAGYPQLQRDLAVALSMTERQRAQAHYRGLGDAVPLHLRTLADTLGFVPNWMLDRYLNVGLGVRSLLRDAMRERFDRADPARALIAGADGQLDGRSPLHASLYLFFKSWLPNYILAAERLDMAHALEVRLPFLDHRLFEVARRTPLAGYTRDGVTKYPLRQAMAAALPAEVRAGGKLGFFAPPVVADDAELAALRDRVSERTSVFFDRARVVAMIDGLLARPRQRREAAEPVLQLVGGTTALAETYGLEAAA